MRNISLFSGLAAFILLVGFRTRETNASDTFVVSIPDTLRFCVELGNAELPSSNQWFLGPDDPEATACSVHIWSSQTITDPCGGIITYDVELYLYDDLNAIPLVENRQLILDANNEATLFFDTRNSTLPPDHPITKNGIPYSESACIDTNNLHRLVYTVVNACDEMTTYEYLLRVDDCVKPRPACVGLSSVVMQPQVVRWLFGPRILERIRQ